MKKIIILLLTFAPLLIFSLTPGFDSHYLHGGGAVELGLAFNFDKALTGKWGLLYGINPGKKSHLNQVQYLGDSYFLGINIEPRYYFKSHRNQGAFVSGLLSLKAMDIPFINTNYQDSTIIMGIEYGIKLGYKYTPLKVNFVKRLSGIGVEPYISLKNVHYLDFQGLNSQALWFSVGVNLVFDVPLYKIEKPKVLKVKENDTNISQNSTNTNANSTNITDISNNASMSTNSVK